MVRFRNDFVENRLRIRSGPRRRPSYHRPTVETGKVPSDLFTGSGGNGFAKSVVAFLVKLRDRCRSAKCPKWKVDTYRTHSWGEFSADIYLWVSVLSSGTSKGFYKTASVKKFVDTLNNVASAGVSGYGQFAWRMTYNDPAIKKYVQKNFGKGHINKNCVPNHGPCKGYTSKTAHSSRCKARILNTHIKR